MISIYLNILETNSLNLTKLRIYDAYVLNSSIGIFYVEAMFSEDEGN